MNTRAQVRRLSGWTFTQSGKPVAFIMDEGDPAGAIMVPQPNWWVALRFALLFARNNDCVFVGGPGQ